MTNNNHRPRRCPDCGWKPTTRYRDEKLPLWRRNRAVVSMLISQRPDIAGSAVAGARVVAGILENA